MLSRRGTTLAELLVALVLGALVLASATGSILRQTRATSGMMAAGRDVAQARAAAALLSAELAQLASASTDLAEARDTALQARTAVVTGVACETAPVATLAADDGGLSGAGVASAPRTGDSLWWYLADSSRWIGRLVSDASTDSLRCEAAERGGDPAIARRVLRLHMDGNDVVPALAPVRVTRQVRLVLYRSGDGTWQFGVREWNVGTRSFSSPQPAAGPFQRVAPDGARTGFRYLDVDGAPLSPGTDAAEIARVARVRITAIALPAPTANARLGPPARDSGDVAFRTSPAP